MKKQSTPIIKLVPNQNTADQSFFSNGPKAKTAGVLGGLAPQSTSLFYQTITNYCLENNVPDFPRLLINSVNPWEVIEILKRKDLEALLSFLVREIRLIENQADFLVMVCNSIHAVIDPLRKAVDIPILAIYEEVCARIARTSIKKVGILGTKTTVDNCFYQKELTKYGISAAVLPQDQEEVFDKFIFEEMLKGRGKGTMKRLILEGIDQMERQGCEAVILACTELPLFVNQKDTDMPLFSSTEILATSVVRECFSMTRRGYIEPTESIKAS